MKTVVNKTNRPLKLQLSRGRVLHLGPRKEGQIVTQDAERGSIQKMVEAGDIELFDPGDAQGGPRAGGSGGVSPDSHGHHPATSVKKRGDR